MIKRPILSIKPRLTVKPEFIDYLDEIVRRAEEEGAWVRFDNEEAKRCFIDRETK